MAHFGAQEIQQTIPQNLTVYQQDNQYATEMLNFTTQYMGAYMRLPMDKQPNTDYVQCEP